MKWWYDIRKIPIWTKIEDLQNINLNALPVYDDRYIKAKIKEYDDKVYTNFCDLHLSEDGDFHNLILLHLIYFILLILITLQ